MNVFDFDGTIYNGDSSVDFWLFCLSKKAALIRYLPYQLNGAFLYKTGKLSKEEFKSRYFIFITEFLDIDTIVKAFWDKKEYKIKKWYMAIRKEDDCIISASPSFLLSEICSRLGIKNLIATEVDKQTGKLIGKNCHDKNKPDFYFNRFNNIEINEFYSDSKSDEPMAKLADKAFIVHKNTIIEWRNKAWRRN